MQFRNLRVRRLILAAVSSALFIFIVFKLQNFNGSTGYFSTEDYFLVVVVPTAPLDFQRRQLIRETWLNYTSLEPYLTKTVRHYFLVAIGNLSRNEVDQIKAEAFKSDDVLILGGKSGLVDSYKTLNLKMMATFTDIVTMLKFKFLFKVDSDFYVNLPGLIKRLSEEEDVLQAWRETDLINIGYYIRGRVNRIGKWAELNWDLSERYLPYASGGAYVLSFEAVNYISKHQEQLRVFKNEDANIGLWLAPLKTARIHELRFNTATVSRGCNNRHLVTHTVGSHDMRKKHGRYVSSGGQAICVKEFRKTYRGHKYNWSKPVKYCCNEYVDW